MFSNAGKSTLGFNFAEKAKGLHVRKDIRYGAEKLPNFGPRGRIL